jgi:hypothetical protein
MITVLARPDLARARGDKERRHTTVATKEA